jgi:phytoene dehydrogenase-like protein
MDCCLKSAVLNAEGKPKKVVVIGAGIAGITAAHHLSKKGYRVVVLDSANYVGGRLYSI